MKHLKTFYIKEIDQFMWNEAPLLGALLASWGHSICGYLWSFGAIWCCLVLVRIAYAYFRRLTFTDMYIELLRLIRVSWSR